MGVRLIRCANSEPVTAYDDAVIFHSAKGHDYTGNTRGGVFSRVYKEMKQIVDNVNHKFIVQSGQAMLYGRQIELPQNETIEFSLAEFRSQYCIVYIEVKNTLIEANGAVDAETGDPIEDYDELTVEMKLSYSSLSVPTIGNTDLIANRYGTATMPLFTFFVDAVGTISDVVDKRYIYLPGVAERARSMTGDDIVNNRKLSNLVYDDKDMVRHTDHAYYADRAESLGVTSQGMKRNTIDDDLFMKNRDAYLVTVKCYPLKTDSDTWVAGSVHTVPNVCNGLKQYIFFAQVITTEGGTLAGAKFNLGSLFSMDANNANFTLVSSVQGTNANLRAPSGYTASAKIEVKNGQAKITLGNNNAQAELTLSGQMYLIVYMIGTKA